MGPTVQHPPIRPLSLFALAVTGVLLSGALGAITNSINGLVSPYYFMQFFKLWFVPDEALLWRMTVAQGIFEGLLFGVFFSLVFATVAGVITGASCPYLFGLKYLLGIVAGALACWALGGAVAVGLAALSPDFFLKTFPRAPTGPAAMMAFAWVGGSIWGAELGGLVCVILGLVALRGEWIRQQEAAEVPLSPQVVRPDSTGIRETPG
jgi:hypothetical protein